MAISRNPLLMGMSGKIGDLVIRQCKGGKIVIAKAPERRKRRPTATQLKQQLRFTELLKSNRKKG